MIDPDELALRRAVLLAVQQWQQMYGREVLEINFKVLSHYIGQGGVLHPECSVHDITLRTSPKLQGGS